MKTEKNIEKRIPKNRPFLHPLFQKRAGKEKIFGWVRSCDPGKCLQGLGWHDLSFGLGGCLKVLSVDSGYSEYIVHKFLAVCKTWIELSEMKCSGDRKSNVLPSVSWKPNMWFLLLSQFFIFLKRIKRVSNAGKYFLFFI